MKITICNQDDVRQRLLNYINGRSGKYVFVASQIGVTAPVISRFRHGDNLWNESLSRLKEFLTKEGY